MFKNLFYFSIKLAIIIKLLGEIAIASPQETRTFIEGEHFKKRSAFSKETDQLQKTLHTLEHPNAPQVMIFFNYGCYGCWLLHKHFNVWSKTNAKEININYYPASFNEIWDKLAKLYYVNKELNVYKDEEVFQQIHGEPHQALWLAPEMLAFYAKKGISKERLLNLFNSFDIARKVKNSIEIGKIYNINLTPDIIVKVKNNSYEVNLTMVGDLDLLFKVIEYLIEFNP